MDKLKNYNIPNHIAVIMDGNARWAKLHKVSKNVGYQEGIKSFERLVKICINLQIKILTVYTLSTENTKRKDKYVANTKDISASSNIFVGWLSYPRTGLYSVFDKFSN